MEVIRFDLASDYLHKHFQPTHNLIVNNAFHLIIAADLYGHRSITVVDEIIGPLEAPIEPGNKSGARKTVAVKFPGGQASATFVWSTRDHSWRASPGHQTIVYSMSSDKRPNVKKMMATLDSLRNTYYAERSAANNADNILTRRIPEAEASIEEMRQEIANLSKRIDEEQKGIDAMKVEAERFQHIADNPTVPELVRKIEF
jgi:hypothetical protein